MRPARSWLLAAAALLATVTVLAGKPTTTLEVRVHGEVAAPGWLLLDPVGDAGAEPIRRRLASPASLRFEVPPGSLWEVSALVPGRWAASAGARAGGAAVDLSLRPAGAVSGRFEVERSAVLPTALELHFESPAEALRGSAECPVAEDGRWRCAVPAGRLYLRLKAAGFASVFRRDVEVAAAATTDLDAVELIAGATVTGFVEAAGGAAAGDEIEVELRPSGPSPQQFEVDVRLSGLVSTTHPDAEGLFQLFDLAPGTYTIEATADGMAPATFGRLRVEPGLETRLPRPLKLEPVVAVPFFVDPPAHPGGEPWSLALHPVGIADRVTRGETDPSGAWRPRTLPPGLYDLVVQRRGDESSRWLRRRLEVAAGMAPIEIELPLAPIEGEIRLGDEPVRALLAFGGWRGEQRVDLYSDPEGRFHGILPRAGEWEVSVRFAAEGAWHRLDPVSFERPRRGAVRVDLELPDTRLDGKVVHPDGRPVFAAKLFARHLDGEGRVDADSDRRGEFSFRGLREGRYAIEAFRDGETGRAEVEVVVGSEPPETVIRLAGARDFSGRVVYRGTPLAGAEVVALPDFGSGRLFGVHGVFTGALGEFRTELPADTLLVSFIVMPPGHAARLVTIPAGDESIIEVADLGGTLSIELGEGTRHRYLEHQGTVVPLELLRSWARLHGNEPSDQAWLLPSMEPGLYRLCTNTFDCGSAAAVEPGGSALLKAPRRDAPPEQAARLR